MARQSGNSLFGSLRGKIWISTSVLAFFICTFGLISYLVVSLLINDAFYGVFTPFLLLSFVVMLFGWWLSNEVVSPVERVILLAKSLERSSSTTMPRTSGSTETDQLLETIQRNNLQIQKIVTLMDKVANGNLDVAPLQDSDRLSTAFQKLLVKVSESITAKTELDELTAAVEDLKRDVSGVMSGNLDATIRNEYSQTREISETFKYLIENMSRLITAVRDGAEGAESAVNLVDEEMQALIQRDELRVQDMSQASIALKQVPNLINKITEDLMGSAKSARQSIEKARHGNKIANQNSTSVSHLRKQVREDVKRIQNLNERSHDIEKVAKTVEDLANRTNMIALNASIQATEMGENGHGFVLVAEEVERLAARANGTNKQISTLNKSILAEIGKVEDSAETTMAEVASLSKYAIETGNVLSEMERYVAQFLNLQENLIAYSRNQSEETDNAFKTFADSISETESTIVTLRDSSAQLSSVARLVRELNLSVGEFRLPEELPFFASRETTDVETDDFNSEGEVDEPFDESVNQEFDEEYANRETDDESAKREFSDESADQELENEEFNPVQEAIAEIETMDDTQVYFEADQAPADESFAPDQADTIESKEFEVEDSDGNVLDLVDFENDSFTESEEHHDSAPESGESGIIMAEEPEYSIEYGDLTEGEADYSEESDDNSVIDLYNASYDAGAKTENFDSGEFATDELIEESVPEDESRVRKLNSQEATVIDLDDIDDLLGAVVIDHTSADNDLTV